MKSPRSRLEICGGIASGKTTLARRVAVNFSCTAVFEDFCSNPFWRRFYQQPAVFYREKNICFLAQHAGELKAAGDGYVVCDYAVVQDLAYARLADNADHLATMQHVYTHLYLTQPSPRLIVHLVCNETEQLRRIRARGRREEDPITEGYLRSLNEALEATLASQTLACPVLQLRSDEMDFANDEKLASRVMLRLGCELGSSWPEAPASARL
jgi:deoxyadenosine/deoxycytidine kinase